MTALAVIVMCAVDAAPSLAAINFQCLERDQSTFEMREDSQDPRCCCRIRCNSDCANAHAACSAEPSCVRVQRASGWATLKAAPLWWHGAPGVRRCQKIEQQYADNVVERPVLRKTWQQHHCDDFTMGDRLAANRTKKLIFDIGFHSGDDAIHYLELGYDVIAIDANPSMIEDGLRRPVLRLAKQTGRLHAFARGVVRSVTHPNQTLTFYVHRRVTEWSTFNVPSAGSRDNFNTIDVPLTTCDDLIRHYGTPHYMKVDIEGFDRECLASLERDRLPAYVSTEDPLQLDHLARLGYTSFKMVSQRLTRRGGRQFSGGLPESAPGQWGGAASVRSHPFYSTDHMHVKIDRNGNRIREEHDLHTKLGMA